METLAALRLAEAANLDLVEVQPMARPPVCRILDYGKLKYLQKKKASESRTAEVELKEMKLRPKTDDHDLAFKLNHVRDWLKEGHKVKISVQFKGREINFRDDFGKNHLDAFIAAVTSEGLGIVESATRLEGRSMSALVAPKKK